MRTIHLLLSAGAWMIAGCGESTSCECVEGGLSISDGFDIQQITVAGPACSPGSIRCGGPDQTYRPGCEYYYITASAEGACKVDLTLKGGETQTRTFTFYYTGGECCAGYHIRGDSMWQVKASSLQDAGDG